MLLSSPCLRVHEILLCHGKKVNSISPPSSERSTLDFVLAIGGEITGGPGFGHRRHFFSHPFSCKFIFFRGGFQFGLVFSSNPGLEFYLGTDQTKA